MKNTLIILVVAFSLNIYAQQNQLLVISDCTPNTTGCYDLTINDDNLLFGFDDAPVNVSYHAS